MSLNTLSIVMVWLLQVKQL